MKISLAKYLILFLALISLNGINTLYSSGMRKGLISWGGEKAGFVTRGEVENEILTFRNNDSRTSSPCEKVEETLTSGPVSNTTEIKQFGTLTLHITLFSRKVKALASTDDCAIAEIIQLNPLFSILRI